MEELTQQQELDGEEKLKEEFEEIFNKYNLEELYLIQEVLEKEIRLSNTAIVEGYEDCHNCGKADCPTCRID